MHAYELPITSGDEACRVLRALGAHRYIAGAQHWVHAFAVDAAVHDARFAQPELAAWAKSVLGDASIDVASRDERLLRRVSTQELHDVLVPFWVARTGDVSGALDTHLERAGATYRELPPFDPDAEDGMFPVLVDAGWELLRYGELDREKHRGLVESFGESILFESAVFDEESAVPPRAYLYEWPALGRRELLIDAWTTPPDLWVDAPDPYMEYLLRGIMRAAKLC